MFFLWNTSGQKHFICMSFPFLTDFHFQQFQFRAQIICSVSMLSALIFVHIFLSCINCNQKFTTSEKHEFNLIWVRLFDRWFGKEKKNICMIINSHQNAYCPPQYSIDESLVVCGLCKWKNIEREKKNNWVFIAYSEIFCLFV